MIRIINIILNYTVYNHILIAYVFVIPYIIIRVMNDQTQNENNQTTKTIISSNNIITIIDDDNNNNNLEIWAREIFFVRNHIAMSVIFSFQIVLSLITLLNY